MTIDCSKLTPGQICVTRGCGEAEYIGKSIKWGWHVFYIHHQGDLEIIRSDGKYREAENSELDIISIKKPKRVLDCWVKIQSSGVGYIAHDIGKDFETQPSDVIACLHIVQEYEEGEGL